MVDYSKWDKFADEISDDEEPNTPLVHHVEDGGSVTIGPDGPRIAARSTDAASASKASKEGRRADASKTVSRHH